MNAGDVRPAEAATCPRSPFRPRADHVWLRSVNPTGPAACYWCGATCDPVADLGDPAPPQRRRREHAEPDASGDLFNAEATA